MSRDCDKVAAEIQFVFINSHEHRGDNSEGLVTGAISHMLFNRLCLFSHNRSPHKIMKNVAIY